jgi:general secretion pathway protein J
MARQPSGLATARGFTLVELLVALLVMAVLTLMAWRGVDGIVRARDISQAELDRSLRLNTAIAQWDRDLLALFDTTAVPPLSYDGATLRLVRRVDAGTIGPNSGPGVQLVAWSLRGAQWTRWAGPVVTRVADLQESWLRSQQATADAGAALVLLDGVSDLQSSSFATTAGPTRSPAATSAPVAAAPPAAAAATARCSAKARCMACAWCWAWARSA